MFHKRYFRDWGGIIILFPLWDFFYFPFLHPDTPFFTLTISTVSNSNRLFFLLVYSFMYTTMVSITLCLQSYTSPD